MSLKVAQHINRILSSSDVLAKKVGDRLFPLATIKETSFPFVTYERENIVPSSTKDQCDDEKAYVAVYAFSDNYADSVDVAQLCRNALDGSAGDYDDFQVTDTQMTGAQEAYGESTFIQKLTFEITTEK